MPFAFSPEDLRTSLNCSEQQIRRHQLKQGKQPSCMSMSARGRAMTCMLLGFLKPYPSWFAARMIGSETLHAQAAFSVVSVSPSHNQHQRASVAFWSKGLRIEKPLLLHSQTVRGMSSTVFTGDEKPLPRLRYLGDEQLMQRQPDVAAEELKTPQFAQQLQMLREAMAHYGGIGIAAPQVGWWTRVFCFGIDGSNPRYPAAGSIPLQFWINPEIVWSSKETNWMWEGCLSVPGMRGWVERPKEVIMKGLNAQGEEVAAKLEGLPARVAQHELDHLDGVLFPSRVPGAEFLVPHASIESKEGWAEGWPSAGSHKANLGELLEER